MRCPVGFCLLLLALPAVDAATPVAFGVPAHFTGDVEVRNATWALLVFPGDEWRADAVLEGAAALEEHAYHAVNRPQVSGGPPREVHAAWTAPTEHGSTHPRVHLRPVESWGALFVRADAVEVQGVNTTLSLSDGPSMLDPRARWLPAHVPNHAFRPQALRAHEPMLLGTEPDVPLVRVQAEGLHFVELRGGAATCGGAPCARSELEDREGLVQRTSAWRWRSEDGTFAASARDAIVLVGGAGLDVTASGSVRLPDLQTATADLEQLGVSVEGQTLRGRGDLGLSDLRTREDGTARGSLSTDLVAARLDESPLAVQATASASAVAAVTLLGLLAWKGKAFASLLTGLFTRFDMDGALEHPNRRALFDYVDENPGTTFRELIGATGMAAGTARHHIAVLTRCDVLIERPFGQTLRYFHCDQEQVGDWDAVVVLRQPDMDRMYRWLLDNPGVMQREILDQAEAWGWRRSTAQHRLKRLVDNRLALVRDLGRSKSYRARVVDVR